MSTDYFQTTDEVAQVRKDFTRAEERQREHIERMDRYLKLYRSNPDQGMYRIVTRAQYVVPMVYKAVETILPRIISVLFSASPPIQSRWRMRPMGDPNKEPTLRAIDQLFEYLFDRTDAMAQVQQWFRNSLIYGAGFIKVGWKQRVRTHKEIKVEVLPTGELKEHRVDVPTVVEDRIHLEVVDIRDLFFAEDARFPDPFGTAAYVIHRSQKRRSEIMAMKEAGKYGPDGGGQDFTEENLPAQTNEDADSVSTSSKDQSIGRTSPRDSRDTQDPLLTIYERWTDEAVVTTCEHAVLLRDEPNPFGLPGKAKRKPFQACFDTLTDDLWPIGQGETLEHTQIEASTLRRQRTDSNSLIVNSGIIYHKDAEFDLPSWKLARPGMAVGVRPLDGNINNVVMPIPRQDINGASYREYEALDKDSQEISGLLDYAVGNAPERREAATTVQLLQTAANHRFDIKIRNDAQAFLNLAFMIYERWKQFMTTPFPVQVPMIGEMGYMPVDVSSELLPDVEEIDLMAPGNPGLLLKDSRAQKILQQVQMLQQNPFANPQAALKLQILSLKEAEIDGIEEVVQLLEQPVLPPGPEGVQGPPGAPGPPGNGNVPQPPMPDSPSGAPKANEAPLMPPGAHPSQ